MLKLNKNNILFFLCAMAVFLSMGAVTFSLGAPTGKTGPTGENAPPCKWGAHVKDPVNDEWLWFGGTGGVSKEGKLLTWRFKDGAWKRAQFDAPAEHAELETIRDRARGLYAAVANRYYVSETEKAAKVDLYAEYRELAGTLSKLKLENSRTKKLQVEVIKAFAAVAGNLKNRPTVTEVARAREAWKLLVRAAWTLSPEPPARAYPAMAYEPNSKKIVLFGGEGVHGAYNDTWVYDCATRKWTEIVPPLAPSPRCAAGMTATGGRIYLAGGFEPRGSMAYIAGLWTRLPVDVWELDIDAGKWTLVQASEGKAKSTWMQPAINLKKSDDGTSVSWTGRIIKWGKKVGEVTGSCSIPGSDAGTAKAGVVPGSILVRGKGFDPAWYEKAPPADEKSFQDFLKTIPANRWTNVKPLRRHVKRDWGTTVLDVDRDQLLHWAGGHSSHCGTDVAHFSLATGRWHILYTPELPFEDCYANAGSSVPAMSGRPWGTHTYLSYAYDHVSGKMIWTCAYDRFARYKRTNPHGVWTYDPENYLWSVPQWIIKGGTFHVERHKTCMTSTPHGVVVWASKRGGWNTSGPTGLWITRAEERVLEPVAGTDYKDTTTFPHAAYGDKHGITYDSKRNRALIMHFGKQNQKKSRIWAVDLQSKDVTVLNPKGSKHFPNNVNFARECTYVPEYDLVLAPTSGHNSTLIYDCATNEWLEMGSARSQNKKGQKYPGYGVSTGVEWDPKRKLLWLVQSDGSVYAMRFERETAGLRALKPAE